MKLDTGKSIANSAALNVSWVTEAFLSCFPIEESKRKQLVNW